MDVPVHTCDVVVGLENGLHLGPSSKLVRLAQSFACDILIRRDDRVVDAKSMIELLTLAAEYKTRLTIEAQGDGAREAAEAVARLFDTNFADP